MLDNTVSQFTDNLVSDITAVESDINWEAALNPFDDSTEYYRAAEYILEPAALSFIEDTDWFEELCDGDMEGWRAYIASVVSNSEASPNWNKLADVVLAFGY